MPGRTCMLRSSGFPDREAGDADFRQSGAAPATVSGEIAAILPLMLSASGRRSRSLNPSQETSRKARRNLAALFLTHVLGGRYVAWTPSIRSFRREPPAPPT